MGIVGKSKKALLDYILDQSPIDDPVDAPVGTFAFVLDPMDSSKFTNIFRKTGPNDVDWSDLVSAGDGGGSGPVGIYDTGILNIGNDINLIDQDTYTLDAVGNALGAPALTVGFGQGAGGDFEINLQEDDTVSQGSFTPQVGVAPADIGGDVFQFNNVPDGMGGFVNISLTEGVDFNAAGAMDLLEVSNNVAGAINMHPTLGAVFNPNVQPDGALNLETDPSLDPADANSITISYNDTGMDGGYDVVQMDQNAAAGINKSTNSIALELGEIIQTHFGGSENVNVNAENPQNIIIEFTESIGVDSNISHSVADIDMDGFPSIVQQFASAA